MGHHWDDDELLAPKVTPLPPRGSLELARRAAGVAAVAIAMTGAGCSERVVSPMPAGDAGIDSGLPSPMPPIDDGGPIDARETADVGSPMPDSGPRDAGIDSAPSPMPAIDAGVIAPMPPPMPEP